DEDQLTAGDDRGTGPGARRIGQRSAGAAEHHVQVGRLEQIGARPRQRLLDLAVGQAVAGHERDSDEARHGDCTARLHVACRVSLAINASTADASRRTYSTRWGSISRISARADAVHCWRTPSWKKSGIIWTKRSMPEPITSTSRRRGSVGASTWSKT